MRSMERVISYIINSMLAKGVIEEKQRAFALFVLQSLPAGILVLGAVFSGYPILAIAPVQNVRAPFSERFGRRMHRILVGIYAGSFMAAGMLQIFMGAMKPILSALSVSGISIGGAYWHNKKRLKSI